MDLAGVSPLRKLGIAFMQIIVAFLTVSAYKSDVFEITLYIRYKMSR